MIGLHVFWTSVTLLNRLSVLIEPPQNVLSSQTMLSSARCCRASVLGTCAGGRQGFFLRYSGAQVNVLPGATGIDARRT